MRKTYKIKKLIDGYKISPELAGKTLIAVPEHIINPNLTVYFGKERMRLANHKPLTKVEGFKDKFGRNKEYSLVYYEWVPDKDYQLQLF